MELLGRDNRPATETMILSRTELEALVAHHRDEARAEILMGRHDTVKQRMERIDQLHKIMPLNFDNF